MGSRFAPSFACIYMHWFEQTHLPNAPVQPLIWRRYIDDIFAVFVCSDKELEEFYIWLNSTHPSIKFTMDKGEQGIPFLDTFVTIEGRKLITRPYTKKTDRKQYIIPSSCHPPHLIRGIPFGQALRIKRICTHEKDAERELNNLKGYFLNRDYPEDTVDRAISKVKKITTTDNISKGTPESNNSIKKVPSTLIIPYHPRNPGFQQAINELWSHHEKVISPLIAKPI
jgi:peptide-methionine (R)-S-oxide reductase